jgi:alpha-beta hydrolase superfamily lysophospholipase
MSYLLWHVIQLIGFVLVVYLLFSAIRRRSVKVLACRNVLKVLTVLVLLVSLIFLTVLLVHGFQARRKPALSNYHKVRLNNEFHASDYSEKVTLQDYLAVEETLFAELREKVYQQGPMDESQALNRYFAGSLCDPDQLEQNWNRSYELFPEKIKGGVLLVHGLTDSPYSLRTLARIFHENGFYVLNLRMPGHGTAPSALKFTTWKDWLAAVKLGMNHVKKVIGPGPPLYLLGYSNGGALATFYTLESLEKEELAKPDRVVLFSPAIGISKFAALAGWLNSLGFIPFFAQSQWNEISPEYDPFKYSSFPLHAGHQSFTLARALQKKIERCYEEDTLKQMPPVMTFQSAVDTTVIVEDIVNKLYDKISDGQSELILFDIDRHAVLENFLKSSHEQLLSRLRRADQFPFTVTLITNRDNNSSEIVAKRKEIGADFGPAVSLNLKWPSQIYSLSHLALPFPPDDPVYGEKGESGSAFTLGSMELRGERHMLNIPVGNLMRLRYNPFFDYIQQRVEQWISADLSKPAVKS